MNSLPIQMRHSTQLQRPAEAVLLPGSDAAAWLEWLGSRDQLGSLRLMPVADPQSGHQVLGALCFNADRPPNASQADPWHQIDRRCPRYGCTGRRLFVPVEAVLDPPIENSEWRELLPPDESLLVWHPLVGLVRFEPEQVLSVEDLLARPVRRNVDWGRAQPGTALNRRLFSLQAVPPPRVEMIFESGQEDIGSSSDKLDKLPPTADEPAINWKMVAAAPLLPIAALASWLSDKIEQGAGAGDGVMAKIGNMLDRLAALTPRLLQERQRELERLLDRLRNDPDEGLKYALPMAEMLGRGVAAPGSRLTQQNVDFQLGSRGGSGPVDAWNMPPDLHAQLQASYREAAAREIRLGRFRRAAYIYASLLGDYQAAANVLEQGRFYREAAAVYNEKLNRPNDAARCLEKGGLLEEAIELYNVLGQHLKVGELYERLERLDEAKEAYRRAVGDRMQRGDRLGAAELLEKHLQDTDGAMTVLEEGWPSSSQASKCLERFFALTSQLKLQPRALAKIEQVRQQVLPSRQRSDLVISLAEVTASHNDNTVTMRAADAARVVASEVLMNSPDSPRVLRALADLAPEDLLLQRDCRRFRREIPVKPVSKEKRWGSPQRIEGKLLREITFASGLHWLQAVSTTGHYFLVGHDGQQDLVLLRGSWNEDLEGGTHSAARWKGPGVGVGDIEKPVLLQVDVQTPATVHLARWNCPPLPSRELTPTGDLPFHMTVATPRWLPREAAVLGGHHLLSYTCDYSGRVRQYDRQGNIVADLTLEPDEDVFNETEPLPVIHVRLREAFVGWGKTLYRISDDKTPQRLKFPSRITGISGSPPHARARLLVTHETGAYLLNPTFNDFEEVMLEEEAIGLIGAILEDGRAVLWCPGAGGVGLFKLYASGDSRIVFQGTTVRTVGDDSREVRMLLPTNVRNQVAVIPHKSSAPIELWQFPENWRLSE